MAEQKKRKGQHVQKLPDEGQLQVDGGKFPWGGWHSSRRKKAEGVLEENVM